MRVPSIFHILFGTSYKGAHRVSFGQKSSYERGGGVPTAGYTGRRFVFTDGGYTTEPVTEVPPPAADPVTPEVIEDTPGIIDPDAPTEVLQMVIQAPLPARSRRALREVLILDVRPPAGTHTHPRDITGEFSLAGAPQ